MLLTLTLISGVLFSEQLFGKPLTYSNKIVFSVLSWLVFGALLLGRRRYGWRGRIALNWILAGSVPAAARLRRQQASSRVGVRRLTSVTRTRRIDSPAPTPNTRHDLRHPPAAVWTTFPFALC